MRVWFGIVSSRPTDPQRYPTKASHSHLFQGRRPRLFTFRRLLSDWCNRKLDSLE